MLAKSEGHHAYFCSGSPERRAALERQGIHGIDQKAFNRFASRDDVRAFSGEVRKLTGGVNMHIVCDMLRGPVFDAGPRGRGALRRERVGGLAALAARSTYNSTLQSVKQVTIDHTHYETVEGCTAATELYGVVFKPTVHKEIYAFEDLPRAMREMYDATQTGIPIIRVAEADAGVACRSSSDGASAGCSSPSPRSTRSRSSSRRRALPGTACAIRRRATTSRRCRSRRPRALLPLARLRGGRHRARSPRPRSPIRPRTTRAGWRSELEAVEAARSSGVARGDQGRPALASSSS